MTNVYRTARLAGVLYLVITAAAIVAHFYVPGELIIDGDPAATTRNLVDNPSLLHIGIGSEFIVLLSEVILSVLLYVLLRPVGRVPALIASVARLAMTTIHGLNLLNYFFALIVAGDSGFMAAFQPEQRYQLVALFLEGHAVGFTIGVVFLSLHAVLLGYLILVSGYFPRILGVLFLIASAGYLIDSTSLLFVPGYETTPGIVALPIAVAELAFPVWLLVRGVRIEQWNAKTAPAQEGNPGYI